MIYLYIFLLAILSGFLGRLGGRALDGKWYDCITDDKARDVGCSILIIIATALIYGFKTHYLLYYGAMFMFSWAMFSLYWDKLFGYDNMWFSGFMTGMAYLPVALCGGHLVMIISRSIVLALIWGSLNVYLPQKVLVWDRAVAEEYLRYFSVIITLVIK
jgi:hypothetical protein